MRINLARKILVNLTPAEAKSFGVNRTTLEMGPGPVEIPDALAQHWFVKGATVKEVPTPAAKVIGVDDDEDTGEKKADPGKKKL